MTINVAKQKVINMGNLVAVNEMPKHQIVTGNARQEF